MLSRYEARPEALLPPGRGPVLRARLISSTSAESNKKAIANASLSLPRFWCSRVVRSRRLRMMHYGDGDNLFGGRAEGESPSIMHLRHCPRKRQQGAACGEFPLRVPSGGCHNDRFGGNGSILSVNETSVGPCYSAYSADAGIMKTEAIAVFQRFYSRENKLCPEAKRRRKDDDDNESRLKMPPSSC